MQGSKVEHAGNDPYVTLEDEAEDRQEDAIKATDLLLSLIHI